MVAISRGGELALVRRDLADPAHGPGTTNMIRIPLDDGDQVLLLAPRWSTLEAGWQLGLLIALLLVPALLVIWLYRCELRLVSRVAAAGLLALRMLLLALLATVIGWQPVIVQEETGELPGRVLIAVDRSASMNVADPQRTVVEKLRLGRALRLDVPDTADSARLINRWIGALEKGGNTELLGDKAVKGLLRRIDALTRGEAAQRILMAEGVNLLGLLSARH